MGSGQWNLKKRDSGTSLIVLGKELNRIARGAGRNRDLIARQQARAMRVGNFRQKQTLFRLTLDQRHPPRRRGNQNQITLVGLQSSVERNFDPNDSGIESESLARQLQSCFRGFATSTTSTSSAPQQISLFESGEAANDAWAKREIKASTPSEYRIMVLNKDKELWSSGISIAELHFDAILLRHSIMQEMRWQ